MYRGVAASKGSYGEKELLDCLERKEQAGVVYHRNGFIGDYDEFDNVDELMDFIKSGKRTKASND